MVWRCCKEEYTGKFLKMEKEDHKTRNLKDCTEGLTEKGLIKEAHDRERGG